MDGERRALAGVHMKLEKADPLPPTLSAPVFSLATLNDDDSTNMNIITYVVPVGIRPKRKWVISLWQKTLTHSNFIKRRRGVLQLLRRQHVTLIPLLGKQSGNDVNKKDECAHAGFPWSQLLQSSSGPLLLPHCAAYYPISIPHDQGFQSAGEHDVAICDLESVYVDSADTPIEAERKGFEERDRVMYTAWLRAQGVID